MESICIFTIRPLLLYKIDVGNERVHTTMSLYSLIASGKSASVRKYLEDLPSDARIELEAEPYCLYQRKAQIQALTLVLNDPRFCFDDLFVARNLYFSTGMIHDALETHPRILALAAAHPSFVHYFSIRYKGIEHKWQGMLQRYLQADRSIRMVRKRLFWRLTFLVYPFLRFAIRAWLARYYAPGTGKGFFRGAREFQTSLNAVDIALVGCKSKSAETGSLSILEMAV